MSTRKKKGLLAGVILLVVLLTAGMAVVLANRWSLELSLPAEETIVLEYGESYEEPEVSAVYQGTLLNRRGTSVEVTRTGEVDPEQLGTYTVIYEASHRKLTAKAERTVIVQDTTPPEITLVSDPEHFTSPIAKYEEEGFTAVDLYDGDLTRKVIRREKDGVVTYTVEDSSGNRTEITRKIVYKDLVPPVITLTGESEMTVELGQAFEEPGVTAADDCDGDLTEQITVEGSVDTQTTGTYTLTYRVQDSYGNEAEEKRTVTVADLTPPVITLRGDSRIYVKIGEGFSDPGVTASDNVDGDITAQVRVSGGVDTGSMGTYVLNYTVTDAAGNTAAASRSVYVYRKQASANPVNPGDKVVYLTFDDGPGKYTSRLLDILDKYGVKATFFVTNQYPAYQNLIGETSRRGHTIALHTYSHDYSRIYSSEDAYFEDLQAISDICTAQTGTAPTILRFPGGTSNTVSRKYCSGIMSLLATAVGYHGYYYCDWNVDSGDAGGTTTADGVAANVIKGIQGRSVSVVLQHDIKSYSVEAVDQILFWGIQNGYTFLPMSESSPMVHQTVQN